jgi:predicted Fe-S protein YdhL (DUF1289 family)
MNGTYYHKGNGCKRHCNLDPGESCEGCEHKAGEKYKGLLVTTATGQMMFTEAMDRTPKVLRG